MKPFFFSRNGFSKWAWIGFFLFAGFPTPSNAQAPGVVIEEWMSEEERSDLLEKALALKKGSKLTPGDQLKAQLKNPLPGFVKAPSPFSAQLDPVLLAKRAREIRLWIMAFYLCPKCTHWHLRDLVAAYPVAPDVVATCAHAFDWASQLKPEETPKESHLLVMDSQKRLLGVSAVLAVNPVMDAVLLRVDPPNLIPVPLNDQLAPGDRVFCYSDPLGQAGYFSDGILNRFFWRPNRQGETGSLEELAYLRVNFGTDWAPGSSGAPILDQCGNVAGHVSSIHPLSRPKENRQPAREGTQKSEPSDDSSNPPLITVHEGIPARGVLALIRDVNQRAGENSSPPAVTPRGPDLRPRPEETNSLDR